MRILPVVAVVALALSSAFGQALDEQSIGRDIHVGRWDGRSGPAVVSTAAGRGDAFESVALHWTGTAEAIGREDDPVAMVRASVDGLNWSAWVLLTVDGDSTDRSEFRYATGIAHFESPMTFLQISIDRPVDRLIATIFPPAARRETAAVQSKKAGSESYRFGSVTVRARSEWGCPDGEGARWTPAYTTVTHAVVHHTAGDNSVPDWDAELRSIWYLHTITNGWGDIGYNFLIDPNGVVYEGRAGGNGAIGAHFSCRNTNTAGVSLLGTYTSVSPTPAALASLRRVLAEITRRNGIDPTATARHVPSDLLVPTIMGHRDGNTSKLTCTITACPGDKLYAMLPQLRTDVACAPAIVSDPASTAIRVGSPATLQVVATGADLQYQWYTGESGVTTAPIEGANNASVSVAPSTTTSYWVRVMNSCATVDSATAIVNITGAVRVRPARP